MDPLPFQVYSQMRSGTHLMMSLLHANFDFGRDLSLRVSVPDQFFDGDSDAIVPWGDLFATHDPNAGGIDLGRVLYVIRHPLATAYSQWRFQGEDDPFEQFASEELFAAWREHAESYGIHEGWALAVRYEDFRVAGDACVAVLASIQQRWSLTPRGATYQHIEGPVGWTPREGQADYDYPPAVVQAAQNVLGRHCLGYEIA